MEQSISQIGSRYSNRAVSDIVHISPGLEIKKYS